MEKRYPFTLPALPYGYDALAPAISPETLQFHHDKHFATYVDNLNKALEDCTDCQAKTLDQLLTHLDAVPEPKRTALRNNGGGVYNHGLYFDCMAPADGGKPEGSLAAAIDAAFGSFDGFKTQLKAAALGQFGSGYAFLVSDSAGAVSIVKTANQDCPLSQGLYPLLCMDVWEHAYYLDHQNRRAEYADQWLDLINWSYVRKRYEGCK
ncbi:MAG: superoxide dismutase [Pseudoflavonifractor sp.]